MPSAEEMREYRKEHPDYKDRNNKRTQARNAAYRRLAGMHQTEFDKILEMELRNRDVV